MGDLIDTPERRNRRTSANVDKEFVCLEKFVADTNPMRFGKAPAPGLQ